jgi:hypothetical protein
MARLGKRTERIRARFGNRIAMGIVVALAVMFGFLMIDTMTEHRPYHDPNWGFGPNWECTPSQMGGDPICFKKSSSSSN